MPPGEDTAALVSWTTTVPGTLALGCKLLLR